MSAADTVQLSFFQNEKACRIPGSEDLISEVQTISPEVAALWLKANRLNRPQRRSRIKFLSQQMSRGQWQVNGQAIIVSADEDILDGQHRLLAVIDSGCTIKSLVIYGVTFDAFKTIDTGAPRTGADALALWHQDAKKSNLKSVSAAVNYCKRIEAGAFSQRDKTSNTDTLSYVEKYPTLWTCAEILSGYPKDARPCSLGVGIACYEIFRRKDEEMADNFMRKFYTGEGLGTSEPEYLLRNMLIKDAQRTASYPIDVRIKMIIKAWNLRRRGRDEVTRRTLQVVPSETGKVVIY